jgi:hypothetical protein
MKGKKKTTDSKLPETTRLESIAGSLGTDIASTLVAAFAGTPVAALLPVLTKTLASSRHEARVEQAIADMSQTLEKHGEQLKSISDAQYKVINEMVLAVLQTTEEKKIAFLRNVLANSIEASNLTHQEADFVSRVVRDMSAREAVFLVENYRFDRFQLTNREVEERNEKTMIVNPETDDGMIVTGLISLGLLIPSEATWDDTGLLRWSILAKPLIELLDGGQSY